MASSADENVLEEQPVRRTRSGRAVKSPAQSVAQKPGRKTKKKTIVVEVEVSEEEEEATDSQVDAQPEVDGEIEDTSTNELSNSKEETDIQENEIPNDTENSVSTENVEKEVKEDEQMEVDTDDKINKLEESNSDTTSTQDKTVEVESTNVNNETVPSKVSKEPVEAVETVDGVKKDIAEVTKNEEEVKKDLEEIKENVEEVKKEVEEVKKEVEVKEEVEVKKEVKEVKKEVEKEVKKEEVEKEVKKEEVEKEVKKENKSEDTEASNVEVKILEEKVEENDKSEVKVEQTQSTDTKEIETKETEVKEGVKKEVKEDEQMEVDASSEQNEEIKKEDVNPETEVISEDELPTVQAVKVPETEEVSDDELPGPKFAELPADTEVVSEDELPTVKKDGGVKRKIESSEYDPGSPTSESEVSASKRVAVASTIENEKTSETTEKPTPVEKEKTAEKAAAAKETKPKLPELDKYWKAVNDDPTDFTGWTYLLQYVDQVNDIEAAREAYDAFLSHYPYCYGYWRKYADYEKRKGNKKKCEEVFERGLKAIPLSVDLWLHFLNYTKTAYADNEEHIREQFERALAACGLEFRSDRLWDTYIKWETEGKRLQNVTAIYDRLLVTPTQGYTTHFDNFQEHVSFHAPNKILSVDEFLQIRKEVRQMLKHDSDSTNTAENPDIPPGEDDTNDDSIKSDEETKALKERIVSIRRKLHKTTVAAVTSRWNFEEGIKRPYFHVKPLERCQLKNWKEYLDFEIEQGDRQRIMVLFERCLIACALYEEFWLRYVKYLEDQKDESLHPKIREVYERACTVHHVGKPALHLAWAIYEEATGNLTKASEILVNLEKSVPNLLQVAYRRINLERRRGDLEKCAQLYEYYINNSKNKLIATNMAIKYARFCYKICHDFDKAVEILKNAITKDPSNPRIYLQLIDLYLQKDPICEKEVLGFINQFLEKDGNDSEQKVLFAQRKLEFLEDFGSDIQSVQQAYEEYQKYCKINKEKKKKEEAKGDANAAKKLKADSQPPLPNAASGAYSGYGNYGSGASQNANSYSQYGGTQSGYGGQYGGQYPQGDQYQYQNWQYSQPGYGGYNQWGSYGNYYQ